MKFVKFMSYYERKNFVKKFCKISQVPGPFVFSTTSIGKWNFWGKLLILDIY